MDAALIWTFMRACLLCARQRSGQGRESCDPPAACCKRDAAHGLQAVCLGTSLHCLALRRCEIAMNAWSRDPTLLKFPTTARIRGFIGCGRFQAEAPGTAQAVAAPQRRIDLAVKARKTREITISK